MEIGAKIYYDKETGIVIQEVGERSGGVVETTTEQDFTVYSALAERVPDTVGMIQFEYMEHEQDREEGGRITRIDLNTLEPLFTYPESVDPETPQEPRPALSKQVDEMQRENGELKQAVAELSLVLAAVMGGGE
ncbi:hypothetical protein [Paenibacillus sp. 7523-1]|uniref:hypothetical protein n=1 Tax=Paenibacillus sp. 7523-1 TaxID=2022550 RepID=UPI000BA74A31|nr:hypothetical protein [Paenibacillus sp. 7523-1]PAD31886.1 hypothetical protein CHH60_08725 [Paenibacillus sp. 7523-1]